VGEAGRVATEAMDRAKQFMSGRADVKDAEGAPGVRVEAPEERPRVRVDPASGAGERDERAEIEAEAAREDEAARRSSARGRRG
jgi:hypothetical protein